MSDNRQIDVDFVNFIAEEVKHLKSPMSLKQLCSEFKKKSGTSSTETKLIHRLQTIRDKMSEMENFDIDTKVKMMFVLGSPVSNGLLIELKRQADIELDDQHRIIEYKKNGNGLQLSGVHIGRPCGNEKEMLKFLAEKSENATSPMSDRMFLKKYIISEGNSKADRYFSIRYKLIKQQIYLAPEFDQKTKIKMMFVSNTKVHASILKELRQTAIVEVDEHRRITKYEANDGSLKLKGNRKKITTLLKPTTEWSKEEKDKLLSFVAKKSKQTKVPLVIQHLSREFAEKNGMSRTMHAVELHFYRYVLPNISKLNHFDIETRMRMCFALSVSVDEGFLIRLRKKAFVEVDEHQRITKYKANDGKLKLEAKRLPPSTEWSKGEMDRLWNYIAERSKQAKRPLLIKSLCSEFVERNGGSRTKYAVLGIICRSVCPKISKQDDVDMKTKIRMLFALSVPVDEEFLNKLRKEASVKIDEKRRITKYKANDGSLELNGDHSKSAKMKTIHTQKESNIVNSEASELDGETEDSDDEEDEGEVEEVSRLYTRSGRLPKRRYPEVDSFSDSDDDAYEFSRSIKKTKLQKTKKITNRATSQTQRGIRSKNLCDSDTGKVTEDEKSEEEYEEKEEEFEANSSTRKSERVSKNQNLDNDFCCDFDDVSFDYPENVNNSRVEKEKEKLAEMLSGSSSEARPIKNQKRKNVENPSDTTNSISKTQKVGRVANTQNDAESEITASGTNQNDGEVIINDISEESLPHKEVKPENVEYKPDLSFLSNTTQYNIQNFSVVDRICTDDVDQSAENTDEMTSGKEFMKLLRGLVDTLDSPILVELQSKIEKAIEKLGDKDHKIPIDDIVGALNTGFIILNKNATMVSPQEESTSLRDFFLILRSFLSTFRSSSLSNFQLKLKENIKKLDSQDKKIPIESIRPVLETVLLLSMP